MLFVDQNWSHNRLKDHDLCLIDFSSGQWIFFSLHKETDGIPSIDALSIIVCVSILLFIFLLLFSIILP